MPESNDSNTPDEQKNEPAPKDSRTSFESAVPGSAGVSPAPQTDNQEPAKRQPASHPQHPCPLPQLSETSQNEVPNTSAPANPPTQSIVRPTGAHPPIHKSKFIIHNSPRLLFAFILLAALFFRTFQLTEIPPGLWYDEALYSMDGYSVMQGHLAIFFAEGGHPREPLFPWLLGIAFSLFGPTVLVARAVCALCGTLAVALIFPVARRFFSPGWALAAMAAFAAFRWHIHFSRTIFRADLASLMMLLVAWSWLAWAQRPRHWRAALCGAAIAACLYTYISLRVAPLLVILWTAWPYLTRTTPRIPLRQTLTASATAAILFLPLGIDYLRHPDHLSGRTDEITMFEKTITRPGPDGTPQEIRVPKSTTEALTGIAQNALGVAKAWFIKGDHVAKHNIPYRPIFDPLSGLLFTLGILIALKNLIPRNAPPKSASPRSAVPGSAGVSPAQQTTKLEPAKRQSAPPPQQPSDLLHHQFPTPTNPPPQSSMRPPGAHPTIHNSEFIIHNSPASLLLLTWFAAFAAASIFSFGAPNILRMQGASPVVILLMILGLRAATRALGRLTTSPRLPHLVAGAILVIFAAMQLWDYFVIFPRDLRVRQEFTADVFYEPARAINHAAPHYSKIYVPEELLQSLQFRFATIRQKNIQPYPPDRPLPTPPPGQNAFYLVTIRSLQLAQLAGQDHLANLDTLGAQRQQIFTIPQPDPQGRLQEKTFWAETWSLPAKSR